MVWRFQISVESNAIAHRIVDAPFQFDAHWRCD
jgi:hypothetical protein